MAVASDEKLGTEKMLPLLLKMAIPAVVAQFVNLLYNLVDKVYIGHIEGVGKDALAGVGVTTAIITIISAFAQLVGGGAAPMSSMALGQGDRRRSERIMNNGFVMLLFFAVICTFAPFLFMEPMLRFAGASDVTLPYAIDYLKIYLMGTVFVMLAMGLNAFISAEGRPGMAMLSVLIGAVMNTILDPLFIFAFDLGVKGAAIATIISQAISAAFIVVVLCTKKSVIKLNPALMKPNFPIIGKISSIGISPFVMASTEGIIGFALNSQLLKYGGDIHVSAMTVMMSAMQMISIPLAGFTQGLVPIVSYNYGHGRNDRVKSAFKLCLIILFTLNFIGAFTIIIFPKFIGSMFTPDEQLLEIIGKYLPIFMAGMTIFGLQRACQNTFLALGQAKYSLFIALLRKIFLLVPLAYILPAIMNDVMGIYLAEAIADGTAAIICITIFCFVFPKILKANKNAVQTN